MAKGFNRPAGGGGQSGMMQQIQRLQQQLAEAQAKLAETRVRLTELEKSQWLQTTSP